MSGNGGYDAADLADKIREGEVNANIGAVLADTKTAGNIMLACERADLDADTSPLMTMLDRTEETDMLRGARKRGHVPSMNAATGLSDRRTDATGYDRLINEIKKPASQTLIKGPKGSGKTTKASDIIRELDREYWNEEADEPGLSIFTNVKFRGVDDLDHVTFGETVSEMLVWNRDTKGEKVALLDEISTTLNSHANPGGDVRRTVSRFINALRKGEGGSTRLILIGHEHDTDVAAILRNQSDLVIRADGKVDDGLIDCVTVFDGWNDYLKESHWFRVRGLLDVPSESPYRVPTNYFAHFELDLDAPEKQIQRGRLIEKWERYQSDYQRDEEADDRRVSCRGIKDDGKDCNALTDHESGFCPYHREQWDGDGDPRFDDRDRDADGGTNDQ
ncbi:AAA family ATPase [Halovivax gelatinilyticus]|uniref:AAA family ATPase n=1 Tax=Halovivax gelatinilyticus TaxID=2961597 RepID=UPI0020CA8E3B|nr:AAA family ATPase [Halovivax gelatinilyticus]